MWPVSSLSQTCISLSLPPRSLHLPTISSKCALLVRQLVDVDPELRRAASRAIKHAVIGSWARKALFIEVGVVAGLLESLKKDPDKATLIENIATIGSFAHGSSEQAVAVCAEPVVNQLLQRLAHDDPAIVEPCARAVRTLIHTGNVALESLIVGPDLIGKLILHLSMRRTIALYSATIVTCCCTPEHIKRWFVDARGIEAMFAMLARLDDPASTAVVLKAIAALTDGPGAALCCASMTTLRVPMPKATRQGFSAESGTIAHFLFRLVHHQDTRIRILASRCLTNVYREHPESLAEDGSPERVLEAVLKLLQDDAFETQIDAMLVLALLVKEHEVLQQHAAQNGVLPLLTRCFNQGSGSTPQGTTTRLHAAALTALAAVCSKSSVARKEIVKAAMAWDRVVQSLTDPKLELRRAAASCILSVSRSVQTLRTTLVESGVTRPLCGLLDDSDMQVRCTAVAAMCNLVMEFSPVKKLAMDLGVIAKLVKGTHSEHSELRLNSVWGLKNLIYEADSPEASVAKSRVMDLLSWPQLLHLLDDAAEAVQEQAIGTLRNLVCGSDQDVDRAVRGCGGPEAFFHMLEARMTQSNARSLEQLLYVVCNVTAGDSAARKDGLLQREKLVMLIMSNLRHPIARVKVAALWCVINITAPESEGAKLRQAELVKIGVLSTIVELLISDDLDVKDRSRSVMEQFSVFGKGALSENVTDDVTGNCANNDMELSEDR